jgi:hypothetical protein
VTGTAASSCRAQWALLCGGFVDSTTPIAMCAGRDQSQRLKEAEIEAGATATLLWSSGARSDQKGNTNKKFLVQRPPNNKSSLPAPRPDAADVTTPVT